MDFDVFDFQKIRILRQNFFIFFFLNFDNFYPLILADYIYLSFIIIYGNLLKYTVVAAQLAIKIVNEYHFNK